MLTEKDFYDYFAEETISIGFVSTQKPEEPNHEKLDILAVDKYYLKFTGGINMLSTDVRQKSMIKRIEQVVSILMEDRPFFKEELNYSEIVKHLVELFKKNLPFEEFNTMSEAELKEHCSFIMSTEILLKIGGDFTPEQMAIFDEAIKRK